ncbi:ABC transporter permease [Agromyces sp. H3Y2-19a]|jgi:peptide/nickel transport system permease protein|uniref:ABC transporter permease n=1 Tax=Agromyces TaxID=33877 RepID=UPI001E57AFF9|nr:MULTISPECIES: ABC transporter permease [Agromyces]MCD5348187.1 ABC transporter permease [Agromyces sp. S2-1-8]MDF0514208.1 ABC transporter permease [Agromyces chromiiresistens]
MLYVLKRLVALALVLLVSSFIVFSGMYLAPGSPEQFLVQGRTVSPEVLDAIRAQYGLDDPFLVRYWNWLIDVLHGDFGRSLLTQQDVSTLIESRLPTTLFLAAYAAILIVLLGVGLGILAATRSGAFEKVVVFGSNLGFAVPTFFAALVLMALFGANLGWFPVSGSGEGFADRVWHLTLPAIALAFPAIAVVARITRTAVREEQGSEHVVMAVARGVPKRIVLGRHTIRNSMLPVTTVIGTNIAGLLASAFVIEYAFTLDGIGSLLVNSVQKKDFAVVQAIALIMVLAFGLINLIVDLLYAVIDPRVRLAREVSA